MFKKIKTQIPLIVLFVIVAILAVTVMFLQRDIKKLEKDESLKQGETIIPTDDNGDFQEPIGEDDFYEETIFLKGSFLKLEGSGNTKTESFTIGKAGAFAFYITKKELPDSEVSFTISLYKEKETEPVLSFTDSITREKLVEGEWNPEIVGEDPKGTIGGIAGESFEGPGEFYFQIEVENIDRWFLEVSGE